MKYKPDDFLIRDVKDSDEHLKESVRKLGDKNSRTLGLIKFQQWNDYFKKGNLILALSKAGEIAGFLAYNTVKRNRTITLSYLCVDQKYRGCELAQKMNDFLVQKFKKDYREVRLKCRVDYGLDLFWKSLGYYPILEQAGKATRKPSTLMNWKRDFGHVNLFNFRQTSFVDVFLDYQVFLKACEAFLSQEFNRLSEIFDSSYSSREEVNICISQEHLIKISECSAFSRDEKNALFSCADRDFQVLRSSKHINFNNIDTGLEQQIKKESLSNCISSCIENGISFLVANIPQELALKIEISLGLRVLSISDLSRGISSKIQAFQYSPFSVTNSFSIRDFSELEAKKSIALITKSTIEEEKCIQILDEAVSFCLQKDRYVSKGIFDEYGRLQSYIICDNRSDLEFKIEQFFCANSSIGVTTAQYLISYALKLSIKSGAQFTRILKHSDFELFIRLLEDNLFFHKSTWIRAHFTGCTDVNSLLNKAKNISRKNIDYSFCDIVSRPLQSPDIQQDILSLSTLEKIFWPVKFIDAQFENYVIPIEPRWAKELFDEELASQTLLGNDKYLLFNSESVYYKSKFGSLPSTNSRILWYVSGSSKSSRGFSYVKSIRACSIVSEVMRGLPQDLFDRYKHLGVYSLTDLEKLAGKQGEIVAIRFGNTEIFDHPVPLDKVQYILRNKATFTSLFSVKNSSFIEIYKEGCKYE